LRGYILIILNPFLRVFAISVFLKVINAPKTPKRGGISGILKLTFPHIFFQILAIYFMGSPNFEDLKKYRWEGYFRGT
jgi:threonine/homoserine/homoserine lactone efflux protein